MPEIKNTFLKAKMNKSLDDRLLPEGEYRDALNVQITKNDGNGSDVGVVHNIKGNTALTTLGLSSSYKVIGAFFDDKNNTVYWFVTNSDQGQSGSHRIYKYTPSGQATMIVSGAWLKFHEDNPITGVNVLENYLFWTDNRNQPRRINLDLADNNYYDSEEKVSVAKYAPYLAPTFSTEQGKGLVNDPTIKSREIEEKFVRFAYRYKFKDNTYSLISPFTSVAFIPKDHEINNNINVSLDDENAIHGTSEVAGMVNGINRVDLKVPVEADLHIKEIDILYKESNSSAIRIIETLNASEAVSGVLDYSYKSTLPKSTLPERQITRVFDNVPTKALAQEVIANRIVYGNITLGYDIADNICDYEIHYGPKENTTLTRHSIKQRRTYEVGIILSDKFGRTSPVILSKTSTVYVDAKDSSFDSSTFNGDALKIIFKPVQEVIDGVTTNVAIKNAYHETNNPFGWYSYKIVVKQVEQEYYNVYTRGVLNFGNAYIDLSNDNVNKVPRDDTNYNLQNDKIATSNVRLYPKVLNEYSSSNNGGDYAKSYLSNSDLIKVVSIGIAKDLNLVTDTESYITGMELGPNPLMAKLSAENIGAISSNFYKKLAVFETEPVKSSLDIYYETPTSGLVSFLNEKIEDTSLTAISFSRENPDLDTVELLESSRLGTVVAEFSGFYDDDQNNKVLLNSGVTYELSTPSTDFELYFDPSDAKYKVKTITGFAFSSTPSENLKTIDVVGTYGGSTLTRTFTIEITNSNPTIDFVQTAVTMPTDQAQNINVEIANFDVTDGSLYGSAGVQSVTVLDESHYEADGTFETNTESVFGVSYTQGDQNGYIYVNDNQHLHNHVTGDYIVLTLQVSDGTNTSTDSITINLTTSGVVGSGDEGQTISYYFANWFAFDNYSEACNSSTMTSTWELVTIFYEGTNDPMSITSPSTPYADRNLTQSSPSGWYKSTAGTVGKWQSDGQGGGGWVVNPISCPQ